MRAFYLILIVAGVTLSSCVKTIDMYDEFEGTWLGSTDYCSITVTIPSKGKGRYYKVCDTVYVEAEGIPFLKSKYEVLKIGKKEFEITPTLIDAPDGSTNQSYVPYLIDDTLRMTLEGIDYTRIGSAN